MTDGSASKSKFWWYVGLSIVAAIIVGLVLPKSSPMAEDEQAGAKSVCREFVKDRLKSPASAKFPDESEAMATELLSVGWRVRGYVDSQNSFGAMLRSDYTCDVKLAADKKWHTSGVTITTR